jgi:hypothetical protein
MERLPGNDSWLNLGDGAGIHNSGGIVVDPQDHKRVYITSGDGVWGTKDILWDTPYRIHDTEVWMYNRDNERKANSNSRNSKWSFAMDGIEVLVPLDMVYGKDNLKFSSVTDYGLFKWSDPDVWAVRDQVGRSANLAIATAITDRGLIVRSYNAAAQSLLISRDNGTSWTNVSTTGLRFLDAGRGIEVELRKPIVQKITLAQDGKSLMANVSGVIPGTPKLVNGVLTPVDSAVSTWYQTSLGANNSVAWNRVRVPAMDFSATVKLTANLFQFVADQVAPHIVYAFCRSQGIFALSTDRGATFSLVSVRHKLPKIPASNNANALAFGWNETADVMAVNSTTSDLVATPRRGELWICFNDKYTYGAGGGAGLWRITGADNPTTMKFDWFGATKDPRAKQLKGIFGANLSIGAPNPASNPGPTDYALYAFNATMITTYEPANVWDNNARFFTLGDFRSDDYGETWHDISDAQKRTF